MAERYLLSFSAASFRLFETVLVANSFMEWRDWGRVAELVKRENLLGLRSVSSGKRVGAEIITRLKTLSSDELPLLASDSDVLRRIWTWIAICRTYAFIAEFVREVVLEKFMVGERTVTADDFAQFVETKALLHPELLTVSGQTLGKLRQTLFKILMEAEIITRRKEIIPTALPPSILSVIPRENYCFFPMFVQEGA